MRLSLLQEKPHMGKIKSPCVVQIGAVPADTTGALQAVAIAHGQEWQLSPAHACACLLACRLHAQGLTLAALVACAGIEYWEHSSGAKIERVAEKTRELSTTQ